MTVLLFFLANVLMAWYHSTLIKKCIKIRHGLWGGSYLVSVGLVSYFGNSWELAACLLFLRKWSFDISLNLFRDLPMFYVSKKPASIIDKAHNYLFGKRSEVYMAVYFIATIILCVN